MLSQLVGPTFTANFWKAFKDNYITRNDIDFIASTGANTIRLPFHYKLFTDEDYMGQTAAQDGFARIDSAVAWCKANNLYLILDMHDAPGGQTGDNIDDSFGYPWLFEEEDDEQLLVDIWKKIAAHYVDETTILAYELLNEPIAHYFENVTELNSRLEIVHKRVVKAIRSVDTNHIIILGGSQWNSNFKPFKDWTYDKKIMYSCHRYGGPSTSDAIDSYIAFRDLTRVPMLMGEIGHNTYEWQANFVNVMKECNIGYTFWPYKKIDESCMVAIKRPANWDAIVSFAESPRESYSQIRDARPPQEESRRTLMDFIEAVKFANCQEQTDYINSMGLK